MGDTTEYHLRELEVALSQKAPAHALPVLPAGGGRVLDIGCGAGQTLFALPIDNWTAVGMDIDQDALKLGATELNQRMGRQVRFLAAGAESLPFADQSFDYVISRVALPYTDIPVVMREVARVLRPGGRIWFTLHPWEMFPWSRAKTLRSAAYLAYVAVNSAWFHVAGGQFRYPLKRSRVESYQSEGAMRRCVEANGMRVEAVKRAKERFVLEARKAG